MANVVVVDDSQFMRVQIREILEEGGHEVIGEAGNGKEAVEAVHEHGPDVVTMDVKMPGMDGIEAVERIMAENPTPVLMLSRYTDEGAETTLDALDAGAVDFMMKPDGEVTTGLVEYADDLVELVDVVSRADVEAASGGASPGVEAAVSGAVEGADSQPETLEAPGTADWEVPPTLLIAASTGGPSEIHTVLGALPRVGLRVLVVQHMPEQFTDRFAKRLDEISALDVREATDGDRVGRDEALVARGGRHLEVDQDTGGELVVSLTEDEPVHSVRPAADVTLESGAKTISGPIIGMVLSGMGYDGTAGAEWVADAGGTVIAQEPETASIASMPERAIATGTVDRVLPPADIAGAVLDILESTEK